MKLMNILAISTCAVLILGGCSGSNKDEEQTDKAVTEKIAKAHAENAPSENSIKKQKKLKKKKQPKRVDRKVRGGSERADAFGRTGDYDDTDENYVLSLKSYGELSVLGLKPMMTVQETHDTLIGKDFKIPPKKTMWKYNRREGNPLGQDCSREKCAAGSVEKQNRAMPIHRDRPYTERITPTFFIDKDGVQKLVFIEYWRKLEPSVFAPDMLDTLVERYGEPWNITLTTGFSDQTDKTLYLTYKLGDLALPNGKTEVQGDNHNSVVSRINCLNTRTYDVTVKPTKWCSEIMELEEYPTHVFFRASGFEVMKISVGSDFMSITLSGGFYIGSVEDLLNEEYLKEKIIKSEHRLERKPVKLDDL